MPITIIADTGVNNLFFNTNTGRNIILSGLGGASQNIVATGNFNNSDHNSLGNIQGGSSDNYYHLTSGQYANLVTGQVIRPSDTGIFYTIDNPSGYISTGDADNRFVNITGEENISGSKTFTDIVNVNQINFNTLYTGVQTEGALYWNNTEGTLDLVHDGATQQIGQELYIKVQAGEDIDNGTPVYINGRQGNRPKVYKARGNSQSTAVVAGLATEDILSGDIGFITTFGYVRQIKTNYSGDGDWGTTWNEGDDLYVSTGIAGQLTNIEPSAPNHSDIVGHVGLLGGNGIGSIFVDIRHHQTLQALSDVNKTPLVQNGQIPTWNQDSGYFDFDKNINDYYPITNPFGYVNGEYLQIAGGGMAGDIEMSGLDIYNARYIHGNRVVSTEGFIGGSYDSSILPAPFPLGAATTGGNACFFPTGGGVLAVTGDLNNYYPRSNPSGYITGFNSGAYATVAFTTGISGYLQSQIDGISISGDFYPNNNPSGYITGVNLSSYATITGIQRSWNNLVMSWTEEPVLNTTVSSGEVYDYVYGGSTYYRFVPTVYNSIYDSFYESFSDPNLSNLICRRGTSI